MDVASRFEKLVEDLVSRGFFNSKTELAHYINQNSQGLSDLMKGRKKVRHEHLQELANYIIGLNIGWVLEGKGEMYSKEPHLGVLRVSRDSKKIQEETPFARFVNDFIENGLLESQKELADLMGETPQSITDLKSGKKKLRVKHIHKIKEVFPEINIDYLLGHSEGQIELSRIPEEWISTDLDKHLDRLKKYRRLDSDLNLANESEAVYKTENQQQKKEGVAYYDLDVSAGPIEMFQDTPEVVKQRVVIPGFEDCDIAINVWGDSMYPHYRAGNMVICKKVEDKGLILYGEVYLVITPEFRTIKYLKKNDNPRLVTLRSANDKYDDVDIEVDKIIRLYHVKGKIERNAI